MPEIPSIGSPAPDFEGKTADGKTIRLSDFSGRKLALYFYPKDDTPGCTKQACSLRDGYGSLFAAGISVVGISADSAISHQKFIDKYTLPFPLIADDDRRIAEAYGTWDKKSLYGRIFMGIKRTTFLIDENSIIRGIITKPRVGDHAGEIINMFNKI